MDGCPTLKLDDGAVLEVRYHVPRSQVWPGSRGGQRGYVHLQVLRGPHTFTAANGSRLKRGGGVALCGKMQGWWERAPERDETEHRCPRCVDLSERYGVSWPTEAVA
jgi:hypothetical protein